ncbi:three-Cys-motif partner protein TcmP [Nocardia nova]|uniref:three-Cys-motif partner protein TcmP n=1 Tax=Nocardia nova TaxID=37330 RepID=UPI0015E404EA|nr:three-Cys-motif partner protein TcmP [Nocardia nova]
MPDQTIWEIEPHTLAKHEILRRYLEAWFPIMSSWNTRVLFIDGFAGPGVYANGEPGSPRIALEAAAKIRPAAGTTALFLFNEKDPARFATLDKWCSEHKQSSDVKVATRNQDFTELAEEIIERRGVKTLVPTFAFVDPFGFKVPIETIASLVRDQRSELFILFSYNSVNRWIGHPQQQENMQALFGCDEYRGAEGLPPTQRKEFLANLYERQLTHYGKFEHVSRFEMVESRGRTSYFLYHCTRSLKGLEVMRSAMWKIDPESGCQFSDRVAGLDSLFDEPIAFDLDQRLAAHFSGRTVSVKEVQNFVLTGTPFALEHLKVKTLKPMQERGEITCLNQKRVGTFPDRVLIKFL